MASWITPTFSAGDYTATAFPPSIPAPTWTVDSADVTLYKVRLVGKTMIITFALTNTTIASAVATWLNIAIPYGRVGKRMVHALGRAVDNGTAVAMSVFVATGGTALRLVRTDGASWAVSANNSSFYGQIEFEVMTATDATGSY